LLLGIDLGCYFVGFGGLDFSEIVFFIDFLFFYAYDLCLFLCLNLSFGDSNSRFLDGLLELSNHLCGVLEPNNTILVFFKGLLQSALFFAKHALEKLDQLKERLRCCVDITTILNEDFFRKLLDSIEGKWQELYD
jgi:hypothetical protein